MFEIQPTTRSKRFTGASCRSQTAARRGVVGSFRILAWLLAAGVTLVVGVTLVIMAVNSVRECVYPISAEQNLRNLTIGMFNWYSNLGSAEWDRVEKSGLSWRVHVLPYAEMNAVYDQFHLDEPWDSPHNLDLLKTIGMPLYWSPTSSLDIEEGKTCFLGVCQPGESFDLTKIEFSTTESPRIVLVEVDDEHAVPWTMPGDWEIEPDNLTRGLRIKDGSFLAGFSDGNVRLVPADTSPDRLRRMFGLNEP